MADSVASVYVFHAVFLCKFIAFVEMSRIVHLACRNEVVVDQNDFIRVPQFGKAHLLEFIADKRDEDIMNHDSVHVDRHNVARFYVFSGVVADDFFNYCIAHRFFLPLLIQSVALAHCLYQAACLNDIHQVLRQSCDRVCFSVVINMLIHLDGDGVALFDIVVQIRLLDQTITTIINRRYVAKENKNLYMTELGEVVNNIMVQAFPSIVDVNFTANMESLLDKVEEGVVNWKTVVSNFYPDLDEAVLNAEKELAKVKIEDEVTDIVCEECGRNMVIKYGPHGRFLACPGFPECRNTKPYLEKIGVACPKCGKDIVLGKTKKGRKYYGCENNPDCDFMSWQKPSKEKCPKCGGLMVEKGNKLLCINEACGYIENKSQKE